MESGNAGNGNQRSNSSRWTPTKEQLSLLESSYNQGLRTPTAEQIQEIANQLRMYGQIEGKNVFYWFQNHKARQRQKQKQESSAYFNRTFHKYHHPSSCLNGRLGFYPREHSQSFLPGGFRRRSKTVTNPQLKGYLRPQENQNLLRENGENAPKTLDLFPQQPSTCEHGVWISSGFGSDHLCSNDKYQ